MCLLKKLGEDFESGTDQPVPVKTDQPVLDEAQDPKSQDGKSMGPEGTYIERDDVITDPELVGPTDYDIEQAKKAQDNTK